MKMCLSGKWRNGSGPTGILCSLGEDADSLEGKAFISRQSSFDIVNDKLFVKTTPKSMSEVAKLFVVPKAHRWKLLMDAIMMLVQNWIKTKNPLNVLKFKFYFILEYFHFKLSTFWAQCDAFGVTIS